MYCRIVGPDFCIYSSEQPRDPELLQRSSIGIRRFNRNKEIARLDITSSVLCADYFELDSRCYKNRAVCLTGKTSKYSLEKINFPTCMFQNSPFYLCDRWNEKNPGCNEHKRVYSERL